MSTSFGYESSNEKAEIEEVQHNEEYDDTQMEYEQEEIAEYDENEMMNDYDDEQYQEDEYDGDGDAYYEYHDQYEGDDYFEEEYDDEYMQETEEQTVATNEQDQCVVCIDWALNKLLAREHSLRKRETQLEKDMAKLYESDEIGQKLKEEELEKINDAKKKRNRELKELMQELEQLIDETREEMETLKDTYGCTGMAKLKQVMLQNDIDLFQSIDEYLADHHGRLLLTIQGSKRKGKRK